MSITVRNIILWMVIIVAMILVWNFSQKLRDESWVRINFSEFIKKVKDKQVDSVSLYSTRVEGKLKDGTRFKTAIPQGGQYSLARELDDNGATVYVQEAEQDSLVSSFLTGWLPIILVLAFWIFLMRQMRKRT